MLLARTRMFAGYKPAQKWVRDGLKMLIIDMMKGFCDMKKAIRDVTKWSRDITETGHDIRECPAHVMDRLRDITQPIPDIREPLYDITYGFHDIKEPPCDMTNPFRYITKPVCHIKNGRPTLPDWDILLRFETNFTQIEQNFLATDSHGWNPDKASSPRPANPRCLVQESVRRKIERYQSKHCPQ